MASVAAGVSGHLEIVLSRIVVELIGGLFCFLDRNSEERLKTL
jgi:hypothetical protein